MKLRRKLYGYLAGGILVLVLFLVQVFLKMGKENPKDFSDLEKKVQEENQEAVMEKNQENQEETSMLRVLLRTDDYKDIFHKSIVVSAKEDLVIQGGEEEYILPAGEEAEFHPESEILENPRVCISRKKEGGGGRIFVKSIKRSGGVPAYPGRLWIEKTKEGLLLVNEVELEQYLCGVVNSEMPASYDLEALKAQAVCARTYAKVQKNQKTLAAYHADMDDSTAYQVYMNQEEKKKTSRAVRETEGEVLTYQGALAETFYFSTSCGATSTADEIWNGRGKRAYLTGKIQAKGDEGISAGELREEKKFMEFLTKNNGGKKDEIETWDCSYPWYRWETRLSMEQLSRNLEGKLKECYEKHPENIKTKMKSGKYVSMPVSSVGKVEEAEVKKRGTGGIVTEFLVTGSKKTIRISTEFVIRLLLAPEGEAVIRADGFSVENLGLLPSAFFCLKKEKDGYRILGGGYGHGTGMSQNGAEKMAQEGKTYKEILNYYFTGCEVTAVPGGAGISSTGGK